MVKEQKAQLNYLNIAPRKVRFIVDTIRGLSVAEAQAQLLMSPQRPAGKLLKLVRSAAANAKQAGMTNTDALVISRIWVDNATAMKRSLPRSMGRATPILKRMSHVTLYLTESAKPKTQRFVIAAPEKKKKDASEKAGKKQKKSGNIAPKPEADHKDHEKSKESPAQAPQKGGAFKRFFNRKSV